MQVLSSSGKSLQITDVETNTILSGPGVLAAVAVLCLADLTDSHNYEKSFMHRNVATFTAVKFWYVKISNYNVQL